MKDNSTQAVNQIYTDFAWHLAQMNEDNNPREKVREKPTKEQARKLLLEILENTWPGFGESTPNLKLSQIVSIDIESFQESKAEALKEYRAELIKLGADVNHAYKRSGTPLDIAIKHHNPEAAIWLAVSGAYLTEQVRHFFLGQLYKNYLSDRTINLEINKLLIKYGMGSEADKFLDSVREDFEQVRDALSNYQEALSWMTDVEKGTLLPLRIPKTWKIDLGSYGRLCRTYDTYEYQHTLPLAKAIFPAPGTWETTASKNKVMLLTNFKASALVKNIPLQALEPVFTF